MSLEKALSEIRKTYGEKKIGRYDDVKTIGGHFSTGSLGLDLKLDGGFPRGRMVELYGPESSGKTTLALNGVADCQNQGLKAVFVDLEGTFDPIYAEALGVDVEDLIYIPPMPGEEALTILEKLIRSGEVGLGVIDSVATILSSKEDAAEYGDAMMGAHARLVNQAIKKLNPIINKFNTCLIMVNQIREKIGVTFGNPEYTTGGNGLKFYASVRLDMRKDGSVIKDGNGDVIGEPRRVKIIKCKTTKFANSVIKFDIYYGEGIDKLQEIITLGVEAKVITKSGSWYSYNGTKLGQGRSADQTLADNPELTEEIKSQIFANIENIKSDETE